jgi:hypothetical protein
MGCIDKRVVAGLAAAALAVMVFDPSALGRVLPLLFAAACPIGMIVMMRGATARGCHRPAEGMADGGAVPTPASAEEEIARLRLEVARLRATQEPALQVGDTVSAPEDRNRGPRAVEAEERDG